MELKPNGPDQLKLTASGVGVPEIVRNGCVHVNVPPVGANTGLTVSKTTIAVAVLRHVVRVSVTLKI